MTPFKTSLAPHSQVPASTRILAAAAGLAALIATAPAQQQFSELPRRTAGFGGAPSLLGDVDADGDLDLVSIWEVHRNDGSGRYSFSGSVMTSGSQHWHPTCQALGDMDYDGDLDIVVGTSGLNGGPVLLFLNDGSGNYTPGNQIPWVSARTNAVALGDVDGDGDLDVVTGENSHYSGGGGSGNHLFLNDGVGTLTAAPAASLPTWFDSTAAVAIGDVDGDGDVDIVCAVDFAYFPGGGQNHLLINNGLGVFTDATTAQLPADSDQSEAVAFADIDGDGDLDIVFGNVAGQDRVYANDGAGNFTDVTATQLPAEPISTASSFAAVAFADIDGDRDQDLILSEAGHDRLYVNDGQGTFADVSASRMPASGDSHSLATGDVDGDGDIDMVSGNSQVRVLFNLQQQLDAPRPLKVGQRYDLDVYSRFGPPRLFDVALPYIAFSPASITVPGLGTVGIDPVANVGLPPFVITQSSGKGSVSFTVPNNTAFIGTRVYSQAILVPFPHAPRLSGTISDVVTQ